MSDIDARRSYGVGLGLVARSAAASALPYPELPARMVTHWNAAGEPEGETSRRVALALHPALAPAVGVLFYYAGVLLEHAERNWFVGIKTPWTLSNDEVWKRTHERAAPLFKLAGVVAALGVVVPAYAVVVIAVPVAAIAAYATVYSYLDNRQVTA